MLDLTRSAGASALLLFFALSSPLLSDDSVTVTPPIPAMAADQAEAAPLTATQPVAEQPPSVPPARAELTPSPIAIDRPALPALTPTNPGPPEQAIPPLARQVPEPDTARQLPPQDPGAPVAPLPRADARLQEARLHTGLSWDYCGPRPGTDGLGIVDPPASTNAIPIDITADRVDYDQNTDLIQLQGGIEFVQNERRLEAERSAFNRRTGQVDAAGSIYLDYPGLRLTGDSIQYNLETKAGTIDHARYRVSGNANLRGEADRAWMLSEQLSRYQDILYTTCPPGYSDWSLQARELELDQASGLGVARHARIRFFDVPVLYTPYLQFPIDGRRRSGFLIPTFGSSDETGTDIRLPYYWNIAPNMDATLTPRYMSTRGLMLGAQFRHLASFQELEINGELLPSDQKMPDNGARSALRVEQRGQLGERWSTSVDYAAVSDDQYLEDFGNGLDVTSLRNLTRRGDLRYAGDGWRLLTRFQEFQTVDSSIAPANRPYGQLPHLEFALDPQRWKQLVEYSFTGQYDYFDHNAAVHGNRLVAVPTVRIPLRRSFGYLIPRARLYSTSYDLVDQTPGLPEQPSHLIPSLDIDGTLIFERETDWFGAATLQTLEPRLYYVLTPYEDQSQTPRFDTTALDFSFASLFRPNRFTGYDRIGDENRLTVGLTSRTLASHDGDELFRASLGQIYYFDDRRVQLDGDAVDNDLSSLMAGEVAARLLKDWTALVSAQWNPNQTDHPWEKQALQLRYTPGDDRLLNLAYRFNFGEQEDEQYEDTDISFQMPVGGNVKLVGRWLYSLLNEETVEAFAGIEFGRCCWRLRVLGQHLKRSAENAGSTSIMLQLELAGLGSFGNQIEKRLERGIYGYQPN
ncbi:LPS assembly protein LptD [Thiobaca trueperi]|uniref:LPS-assembly protein LptD n=1 Tax=Thiobaca trueperi TaxID=127458 RepID=A0A4R3MWB5_9GAMM|nr:LPS-assembly protein [Thiobaca trueperi]